MGNSKARDKEGKRTKPTAADLRQMDLWALQAASVGQTGARTDARNPPQRVEKAALVKRPVEKPAAAKAVRPAPAAAKPAAPRRSISALRWGRA